MDHFRKKFNKMFSKAIGTVTNDVMKVFLDYAWPGNVRELEHTLEHAFVLCRSRTITRDDLPRDLLSTPEHSDRSSPAVREDESLAILEALEKAGGNKAKAARLLGIDRATLYRKMQKYNLPNDSPQR